MTYMMTTSLMIIIIIMIMLTLNFIISKKKMSDREKSSPFECGFDPLNSARNPFSLRFYLISLIFLIFDIEIIILFPLIPTMWFSNPLTWITNFFIFTFILILGIYIEWNEGSLFWMK
uniref:NADH-ubiquinone oxidoreductase chain 3 n=1 Tax=Stenocephus fraxini TaxID=2963023 RepID=A0A9E8YZP3_9HYME|nr:NADH dehydrogenase subunit 3 [Stenocephus fraxini]WAK85074.1 NADH dehydrogenase subunit 3 [Stenocephus fraxini]